jgi:LPS O-antigen subunit length determinant protein (WzzB/FepE family)
VASINLMKLQKDYDLTFTVYSELAKQLETQEINVKEDTPVFTVIKPVSVPLSKSKPKRIIIIVIWMIFGTITGIMMVLGREFLKTIKEAWYGQK